MNTSGRNAGTEWKQWKLQWHRGGKRRSTININMLSLLLTVDNSEELEHGDGDDADVDGKDDEGWR